MRALAGCTLLAAAAIVLVAGWQTSTAKVVGSTDNAGNRWTAGRVDLDLGQPATLALNTSDIWPGKPVTDCIVVRYVGTVPDVDVRLFGEVDGGTGLDRFLEARIETGRAPDPGSCDGFVPTGDILFAGPLPDLHRQSGYDAAIELMPHAEPGDEISLRIGVEVADDNAAQGLTAGFSLVMEVRP